MSAPEYVFLNGEIVPWDDAKVHVASVGFKFGTAVFEGIRGYWSDERDQMYLFRLREHLERLNFSQTFMRFDEIIDADYLAAKTVELIRANEMRETVHIMVTVFVNGFGGPAVSGPIGVAITAAPRNDILWVDDGCHVQVSSWQRVSDTQMPMRVKCNANYQNGRLAVVQARTDGYDTALMLNSRGKVAEGPAMCFAMVRNGKVVTPSINSDILESITRDSVIELLSKECAMEVIERDVDRSELAAADEAFFCGTAWEVTPIVSIDRLPVGDGKIGPIVKQLQALYFATVRGQREDYAHWCTPVY